MSIDELKKLKQKKYRNQLGYFIAEGEHLVLELIAASKKNPLLQQSQLYVTEKFADFRSGFNTHSLSQRQMEQICDTKTPQGIFALVPISAITQLNSVEAKARSLKAMYFYQIQDPGNLGTILRSIAWFARSSCLLSPESVDPFNPKVVRASMGAIFHVPLELDVPLPSLPDRYKRIAYLDMAGQAVTSPAFHQADCYVFGNEARGVPVSELEALDATPFCIPGSGQIESLNLSSVLNICEYELSRSS
ncbi:MAG: RNA methyltransferase [Pseudohongiellaceae bacterium]|nr:RNA methyltransferase [Pseudohongiellaceae bacterium]